MSAENAARAPEVFAAASAPAQSLDEAQKTGAPAEVEEARAAVRKKFEDGGFSAKEAEDYPAASGYPIRSHEKKRRTEVCRLDCGIILIDY